MGYDADCSRNTGHLRSNRVRLVTKLKAELTAILRSHTYDAQNFQKSGGGCPTQFFPIFPHPYIPVSLCLWGTMGQNRTFENPPSLLRVPF